MQPRIYTYKITFEEVPYYYYGSKKEKYFNEEYWGSTGAGGRVVGKMMYEQERGIFSLSEMQLSENGKLGAKNTNSQKWQCTITGHISTSAGLSNYQKSRKIETFNRIRLV